MAVPGNLAAGAVQFTVDRGGRGNAASINYMQGICLDTPTSINGDTTYSRHLAVGISKSTVQGNPLTPSMGVAGPGFWRFRWSLTVGSHSLSVLVLQATGLSPRPSMIIRKNVAIGVASDVTTSAPGGTGWVTIGPASVTASAVGVVWVELWNNVYAQYDTAYFDHIVAT